MNKFFILTLLSFSFFSLKGQVVEELLIDSCEKIIDFIYGPDINCDCNFQLDPDNLDFELLVLNEAELRTYFESDLPKSELDSLAVYHFFKEFENEPYQSLSKLNFKSNKSDNCVLKYKYTKLYRGFAQINVSGTNEQGHIHVVFNININEGGILSVSTFKGIE